MTQVYLVQAESNNNADFSSREEFRYSPTTLGVYENLKEAENCANKYVTETVKSINKCDRENDPDYSEDHDACYHVVLQDGLPVFFIYLDKRDYTNRGKSRDAIYERVKISKHDVIRSTEN